MLMKSVKGIVNCFGCGVCAAACSRLAIKIELNDKGFYTPVVDDSICNNCGICKDVCSYAHEELANNQSPLKSYGAWSNDSNVRTRCSSGGVGYELGKFLLTEGYKVCGVKYNIDTQRAEHYIANDEEELRLSIGSKYIQSYTVDAFRTVNRKEKYLVTGTPCQIDSFRRYIRKFKVEKNFILMDFFCHSVPSMLAWKKYIQIVENKVGSIVYASWRNKFTGWHDSWAMALDGDRGSDTESRINWHDSYNINIVEKKHQYNSRLSQGDIFYRLFLGDYCSNPACQKNCKFKYDHSSADIRIGDFWGKTYQDDEDGVNALVAFTNKGDEIIQKLDCALVEYPFEIVAEGQMKCNVKSAYVSPLIYKALKRSNSSEKTINILFKLEAIIRLPKRVINRILKIVWGRR